jgi:hypothetical protein
MRSDAVIPGSIPAAVLLIRTERAAVAVGSVRAYPNGFEFTVHSRLRHEGEARWRPDPFEGDGPGAGAEPDGALRLGVLFADGRRAATTGGHPVPRDDAGSLVLLPDGASGDGRRWDANFWVHPLSPAGPVTLVASWLKYGVAETSAELDGDAIREAAERAVILWPDEPDMESDGGWTTSTMTAHASDDQEAGA